MGIDKKNSKKEYSKPELECVFLDVKLDEEFPSENDGFPPVEGEDSGTIWPPGGPASQFGDSKYIFPDAPASENPFGGSSPSYK